MRILSIIFRGIPHYLAFLVVCFAVSWLILPPASERYVNVSAAYLTACIAAYVVVTLVLPNSENVPVDGLYSNLHSKESWSSRIVFGAPVWIVALLVIGFYQLPLATLLFVMFSVPGIYLIIGYRWARLAIEYRHSDQFLTDEPEEWAEARKRMGID